MLTGRAVGRSRLLRANTSHRAFEPLARLLLVTFGPHVVVAEEFAALPGVEQVVIFGSWVNPTIRASSRWASGDDPLVATIQGGPHLDVTAEMPPVDKPAHAT